MCFVIKISAEPQVPDKNISLQWLQMEVIATTVRRENSYLI